MVIIYERRKDIPNSSESGLYSKQGSVKAVMTTVKDSTMGIWLKYRVLQHILKNKS